MKICNCGSGYLVLMCGCRTQTIPRPTINNRFYAVLHHHLKMPCYYDSRVWPENFRGLLYCFLIASSKMIASTCKLGVVCAQPRRCLRIISSRFRIKGLSQPIRGSIVIEAIKEHRTQCLFLCYLKGFSFIIFDAS